MADPVRAWVVFDADGVPDAIHANDPRDNGIAYSLDERFLELANSSGVGVRVGNCVECVLIPASEYYAAASAGDDDANPPPVLSPVAELIARLATQMVGSCGIQVRDAVDDTTQIVTLAIVSARKIEGGNHG